MVTIGKLGKGQESYYLDSVATSAEDYYAGEGEAPGQWSGAAAAELGLAGEVERGELRAVLAGLHPATGEHLPRLLRSDRLPGFDVTFSAPKSVSVVWAVADQQTAARIKAAHERAVDAALRYLEREAAYTRLGANGHTAARGRGFVAAAFGHRMSRAGDPQLHTHVLVANLLLTTDGRWLALDANASTGARRPPATSTRRSCAQSSPPSSGSPSRRSIAAPPRSPGSPTRRCAPSRAGEPRSRPSSRDGARARRGRRRWRRSRCVRGFHARGSR